jgi:16S rRNA (guanine1516-N2)-methyltransferase
VGSDLDANELFELAWKKAVKRVVVKRPDDADALAVSRQPDFVIEGKTIRYDVYLKI